MYTILLHTAAQLSNCLKYLYSNVYEIVYLISNSTWTARSVCDSVLESSKQIMNAMNLASRLQNFLYAQLN